MSNTHYYAGEQQDPTGLYYDRARYYNPTTGRFIGEDSVGGNGAMPASMNRYTYAQNAPATYTDPSGHDVWSNIDKMVSNYLQGAGVNTLHGLANVATQLGGGGLLALNGFNSSKAAAQLGQWAQNNPILAWAVVNANSLGYGAAVDTLSSYTNLIPVFGQDKMLSEGIAGQDLFSGRQLSSFERTSDVLAGGFGLFTAGWGGAFGEAGSLAEGAGSTCSFDQNTPIATDKGETPIGQLQVGDKVLAYDQQSSTTGYYTVTAVLVNQDPAIEHLTIDDETLTTTPEHPFFTEEAGWAAAGELKAGQHVRKADGSWGEVHQVQIVEQAKQMYNLTVEKAHTFFVGDKQWLVHNTCKTVTLYRVEGEDEFTRFNIDEAGSVSLLPNKNGMLFIGFDATHADYFLKKKIKKGIPSNVHVKAFDVKEEFLERLRADAVRQSEAEEFPDRPQISDPRQGKDLYGVPQQYFELLENSIIQGSGVKIFPTIKAPFVKFQT